MYLEVNYNSCVMDFTLENTHVLLNAKLHACVCAHPYVSLYVHVRTHTDNTQTHKALRKPQHLSFLLLAGAARPSPVPLPGTPSPPAAHPAWRGMLWTPTTPHGAGCWVPRAPAVRRPLGIWRHILSLRPPLQLPAGLEPWERKPGCVGDVRPCCSPLANIPASAPAGQPLGDCFTPCVPQLPAFVVFLFLPFPAAGTFPWEPVTGEGR